MSYCKQNAIQWTWEAPFGRMCAIDASAPFQSALFVSTSLWGCNQLLNDHVYLVPDIFQRIFSRALVSPYVNWAVGENLDSV